MEAIDFLKEAKRKCSSTTCDACQIERLGVMCPLLEWSDEKMEQLVSTIEQWSKEHPIITNARKFKEVFGAGRFYDLVNTDLSECARDPDWWNAPYKEP